MYGDDRYHCYQPLLSSIVHLSELLTQKFIDPSIRDLTERILPLATYYTAISAFVESRSHLEFGLVNHALCAAIRDMLKVCLSAVPEFVFLTFQ